ncbi:hypothetical protein HUU61_16120 [Rhodopseudomonas palustris]|nr:hypothetical protein [Rhodopseudomonas palustris]
MRGGLASTAAGIARFLIETLGWSPAGIVITDNPPPGARDSPQADPATVHYSEGDDEIARLIADSDWADRGSNVQRRRAGSV